MHDLNFPCPKPKRQTSDRTSTVEKGSHLTSGDSRFKSRYLSSYRLSQAKQPHNTLQTQILEKAAARDGFGEPEKFVAVIVRALLQAGCDTETVTLALQNCMINCSVDFQASQLEISVQL